MLRRKVSGQFPGYDFYALLDLRAAYFSKNLDNLFLNTILKEKQVELRCYLMETDFSRTSCYTFHWEMDNSLSKYKLVRRKE